MANITTLGQKNRVVSLGNTGLTTLGKRNAYNAQTREQEALMARQSEQAAESQNNGGLGYLAEKVGVGFMSSVEGIWDYAAGGLAKLFGADDWAEKQFENDWFGDWYSHPEEWFNPSKGWQTAGDVAGGIGSSLPALVSVGTAAAVAYFSGGSLTPLAAGIISAGTAGLGAAGNATKEAYRETGELSGKEFGYGALSGVTEAGVELLSAGLTKGSGRIVTNIAKLTSKDVTETVAKTGAKSIMKQLGEDFATEAIEEGLSEFLSPVYQRITYDPNAKNATTQEIAYAAFVGGVSGMIMSGGDVAFDSGTSFLKGHSLTRRGLDVQVTGVSEYLSAWESKNNTGDKTFQSISETYSKLEKSLESTGGKITTPAQKKLLGDLSRMNVSASVLNFVADRASNVVKNPEVIAKKLNEYYKTPDGKSITYTAEQLTEGYDPKKPRSIYKALRKNAILRELAIADATGRLMMDYSKFAQAMMMGETLATQTDLNRFLGAPSEEIEAVSQSLGIKDWSTLDANTLKQKVVDFVLNGGVQQNAERRALVKKLQAIPADSAKPMPKSVKLGQDGSVRYADSDSQIAITKQGDAYTVYDYSRNLLTKNMTLDEVNQHLAEHSAQKETASPDAKAKADGKTDLKQQDEEIDAYSRENIPDYVKLNDPNQRMIRKVIREGRAKGVSDEDVLAYARISAHSGLDIVYDKEATFRGYNEKGEKKYADGFADLKNNRIVVNPDATRTHERLLLHELGHTILKGKRGKKLIETAFKNMDEEERSKIISQYSKFYRGKGLSAAERVDIFNDEVSAHYAETLSNKNILEKLVEADPSLKDKILSFFKGASKDYASVPKLSKAAQKYYRTYKKLFDEFSARNFQRNATEAQSARISGEVSDARFSLQFSDHIAENQRKFVLTNNVALSQDELELAIEQTAHMVDIMSKYKDILPEDKVGKTLVKNGSYDVSVENTTICVRTLAYNAFVDMVSEKIGRPLTQMESFLVSQKLYEIAKEPQCLYCYVSLDRKAYNDMVLRYIDQRDAAIEAYERAGRPEITRDSQLYKDFLAGRKDTKDAWNRYSGWMSAYRKGENLLTPADVATEAKRAALSHGTESQAWQIKDMLKYAQSASWAKKQTQYVAYYDDILRMNSKVVRDLNKHYGLRWYSFSDYSGAFIVENMQQITDASIRGLKGLAYTKDTDFVKIFASTGMNINISVYAKKVGDHYEIDPSMSANIDEAIALRKKYPNVGIVVVATDTAGVEWALAQKWSDVVIPFHTVRTGSQVAEFYNWTVFNEEQNDSVRDQNLWDAYVSSVAGENANARKKVSKMVYPSEHQNNRETYLRLTEERGLKPRFSSFLDNPNYMKLVNETRQSEAETVALKPVYDVDAAEAAFQKFVDKGGYYEGWYNDGIDVGSEAETVAQDVLAGKKANEVSYGRQDLDAEGIQKGRKSNREHGRRFALQIGDAEVSTKGRYQFEIDSETLLRDISEQNSIERFMPEGLSADFLKAIRRSNGFAPSRLYRGMEAAEMDYIIENGFIKSNSSYNFANQQDQTRFSPRIQTALSYATGFAPAGIREKFFEQGLPAYIVEVGNYSDLNFINEDTEESYTKKNIDTKYITRVIELTYDAETNRVKARDIQIDGMNQAKGELLHGAPSFVQDKVTGTILYEHQDTEGHEDGKYISEKNPDILFDYDMVEAHKGLSFDYNGYLGISGDPENLVPYKADGVRYALDDSEVDFSGKQVYTYTKKEYEKFGWAREAGAITKNELDDLYSKILMKSTLRSFAKSRYGEFIVEVNNDPHAYLDVDNVSVFVIGTKKNFTISRVVRFDAETEVEMEIFREGLYGGRSWSDYYCAFLCEEGFAREYRKENFGSFEQYQQEIRRRGFGQESRGTDADNRGQKEYGGGYPYDSETDGEVKRRFALDLDSEGTQLTDAQQEFFKDSKVRDSKGRLLVLYHGTTANFNTFKKGDVGFHFGTKAAARGRVGYGKNVVMKRVHLNITNPIMFEEDLGSWDADYMLTKELLGKGILTQAEAESVLLTDNKQYRRTTEAANKKLASVLLEKGYDGIAYSNTFETKKPTTSYIAFQSNQAKLVENEAPTPNPDIRYALSETRESIMTEVDPEYKPNIKDKAFSGWTAMQIAFTNAQAGIETVGKKYGVKNIEALVQAARSGRNQAEEMIAGNQYRIGADTKTYQGEGLEQIMRPIARQGEEVKGDFFDYLFNYHNMSRMTLEQRSLAEQQTRLNDIKKNVSALKKLNKRIEKLQEQIKALGRSKKDMETKKGLREKLATLKAEAKELKKATTELDKEAKAFVPLENKPVLGTTDENGIETVVTADQSKDIVKKYEEKYPEFKETAEKLWAFLQNLNQYRVDTGLISQDTFNYLAKLYPHYVPTYRTGATKGIGAIEGKYNLKVKTTVKTATGSTKNLLPPDVMIARQVMETVRAGRINQLANALYEGAEKSGDKTYIEIVSKERVSDEDIAELDPTELRPKNNEVVFFRNGERITMRVSKEIFAGFNAFNPEVEIHNPLVNGARAINNGFKRLVTSLNPAFLLRNTIRDVQDAGINTKYGKTFLKNYARAAYEISHNGKLWQLYRAMGGFSSSVFDFEKGFSGMQNKWGLTKAEGNILKKSLQGVENANAFVEQLPRLAEFISSIEAGNTAEQAILDSADVTTNFGRMGNITKVLNRTIIPFLNPSIQGCSKMIRNITSIRSAREFAALAFKAALVGVAPMVLNMLMYDDDEDYKNLRDTDKENNFLFKVGDTFVKIPRGRVASVIGGLVNRGKSTVEGEDADWAGYVKNIMQQVTPVDSMSRTIFSPFSDVANNVTWYGSAIEGRQFENTAPKDRYDESTSSIAIAIGKVINYSPKKIHYLLDQYSGVIGDFILPATTAKAERGFLSGNFTIDPAASNRLSTDFYEMYDKAQYAKTAGDDTAIYQVKYLNKVKGAISEMYDQKTAIQSNPDLSNAEKLQQTRVVQILINEAYKTALQDFELYTKAIEATAGMEDESLRFTEATRLMYGAERALSEYNDDVYAKCQMLNKAGVDYESLYSYYFTVRDITSDKDRNGKTISGSKRKKVVASIKGMKISTDQKLLLICASGYTLQDNDLPRMSAVSAKKRLLRYILGIKGATQAEKAKLAEMCGFEVKNGRIVTKTAFSG